MISTTIKEAISKIATGSVFRLDDLGISRQERSAAAQTLSRMVRSGEIKRISPGNYYKPQSTPFGVLGPSVEEQFKDLLFDGRTPIGYLTGLYAFNLFRLTTQQASTIEIGVRYPQGPKRRGIYNIRFVLQRNEIKKDNIHLLRLLDCLKWIKKIPDTSVEKSYRILKQYIASLTDKDVQRLITLSLQYPPVTRALLGSMIEEESLIQKLRETLNPLTQYRIGLALPKLKTEWNIL
ncbi:hypothetical protein [Porphyromonas loveana]|uniref:hypothetical protein n=1 Tax=Porphyromonas loveana TaxID=1884669 RepID=UPI0035A05F95